MKEEGIFFKRFKEINLSKKRNLVTKNSIRIRRWLEKSEYFDRWLIGKLERLNEEKKLSTSYQRITRNSLGIKVKNVVRVKLRRQGI